jgi:hypothetical protein
MAQHADDEALAVVERYRKRSDSVSIAQLHALLLGGAGKHQQAVDVLKAVQKDRAFNANVAYQLGRECIELEQYDEALRIAQDLFARGYDTPDSYLVQASAYMRQKQYRQAKTAVESALKKNPDDKDCQDLMRLVSAMLGEGDHSLVKDPIEPVETPAQALAKLPAAAPPGADEFGAYYVARVKVVSFNPGTELRKTELRRVRIVNRRGIELFSNLELEFDPVLESIYVNSVEVTDASGKLISRGKPEESYAIDARSGTQDKILRIPVSGLTADCTLELVVTRRDNAPPDRLDFDRHYFSATIPVQRSMLLLKSSASDVAMVNSAGVTKSSLGGFDCWTAENPPPFAYETMQVDPAEYVPNVVLGDGGATWRDVGDKYLESIKHVLTESPQCAQLAKELTAGLNDDERRLAAIVEHVQSQYAYNAIEFGRRARIPQNTSDIIRNKYGDCKDHALLLHQLLRASGFDARLVLAKASDRIEPAVPSMDQFDHIFNCVRGRDGVDRFFDCTDKQSRLTDGPPSQLAGETVLLLEAGQSRLIQVPELRADSSLVSSSRTVLLDAQGSLSVKESINVSGPLAGAFRSVFQAVPAEERRQYFQQTIASAGVDAQIRSLNVDRLLEPREPLSFEVEYLINGRFNATADQLVGTVPACFERYLLLPEHNDTRRTPFRLRVPTRYETECALHLPAGMSLRDVPTDSDLQTNFGTSQTRFARVPGQISWKTVAHTSSGRFDVAQYPDFRSSRERLLQKMEPVLAIQK